MVSCHCTASNKIGSLNLLEHSHDEHLGALDVCNERHPEIDRHSSGSIPVRGQAEGGDTTCSANTHRQVDDKVEQTVAQEAGHGHHLSRNVALLLKRHLNGILNVI